MRFPSGVSLRCLSLAVAASACGGSSFSILGDGSDASIETGAGSSSGGHGGSSGNGNGGGSGNGSGGGSGSGSGSSSGSHGGGSSGSSGTNGSSGSAGSSSSGSGSSGSSSGGHLDAGNEAGMVCDCSADPSCCSAKQVCCSIGGPVPTSGGTYRCFTSPYIPPRCPIIISDRDVKRNLQPVDEKAILQSVANMSISTWSYKTDDPSVRHLGPMAQDFYSAFGLGDTDRGYYSVDAHGVALAAIKALDEQLQEQNARIERLELENRELRGRAFCGE